MKKNSYIVAFLVLIGFGVSFFWIWERYFKIDTAEPIVVNVEKGDIQENIKIRGEMAFRKETDLEFDLSGIVERVFVKEGDEVKVGDKLVKLNDEILSLEVKAWKTAVENANKNFFDTLRNNKRDIEQYKKLSEDAERYLKSGKKYYEQIKDESGEESTEEKFAKLTYDTAISEYNKAKELKSTSETVAKKLENSAKGELEMAQVKLMMAEENLSKSIIYAQEDGRVNKIWLEEGERFNLGNPVITLASLSNNVRADVSELEIGKIITGSEVSVRPDAFPDKIFEGKVISIENKEIIRDGDKYYRINIDLYESFESLRSGMSVDIVVNLLHKENVLKIPEFSFYEKDEKKFVKIMKGSEIKEVGIETGISDGENIEIIRGLSQDQQIIISVD